VTVVDPKGFWTPSIAIDKAGRPHIAYLAEPNELRYASWTGSSWQLEKVDTWSIMGEQAALALDSHDSPHIVYFDWDLKDLKYAYKNGTTWDIEVVDEYGDVGYNPSIAIDSFDRPHVSFYNDTGIIARCRLKYAIRSGNSWHTETVVSCGDYDYGESDTSLKLNAENLPRIAYHASDYLSYASWNGSTWHVESVPRDPGDTANFPSLALDSRGNPHITYMREWDVTRLDYATKGLLGWMTQTIDAGRGYRHAIALDSRDRPHIAYTTGVYNFVPPHYLYYVELNGSWVFTTVDTSDGVAGPLSIAIDGCDGVHIAYTRNYSGGNELRYAFLPGQDLTPPKSEASSPGGYWRNGPATVEAVAGDSCSGVSNVTLWYRQSSDNSTWGQWTQYSTLSSQPWVWSFTFPAGDGHYQFYTTSFDNEGNGEQPPPSADAIAGYDVTPPVSAAIPMSPYWHTLPSLVVNAIATDSLSGVADVALLYSHAPLDNSTWSSWTQLGTKASPPWSWPFSFPDGEGNYVFHMIATDNATNIEGAKTVAEAVAGYMTPPDYVPVKPQPSSPQTIGLSLPLQLSIEVRNQGGNASVSSTLSFFDSLAPTTPFASFQVPPIPAGGTSGPFTATWTSPATRCSCSVSAFVDSKNNVTESNETNNVYAWTVNVVPGPITSLVIGSPNYTSTATYVRSSTPLDFSVTDPSGAGIKRTRYRTDNGTWNDYASPFFLNGDGDHYVEYYSEDNVGNVEGVSWRVLRVDDTPPATTFSVGEPKYLVGGRFVNSSTLLTFTANDGGVGSKSTFYRLWGESWSPWREYTALFTITGRDGAWFVEFLSYDFLGNREGVENETLILDNSPPATSILPATGPYTTATVFTLTATDSGCGVNVTMYRIDDGSWTVYTGGFTLAEGEHTIYYYSIDNLGNTEEERSLVVRPPVEVSVNYKPVVAVMFAIILLAAGVWSSQRRPWKGGKDRVAVAKAFMLTSMPFVLVEAATGILSLSFEPLRIPPLIGWGTGVDCTILAMGFVFLVARLVWKGESKAEQSPN
jgi:hypothetical protein